MRTGFHYESWLSFPRSQVSWYQNVFVQNHSVLDRHENMLCKRIRFVLPNELEYMGLRSIANICVEREGQHGTFGE